MTGSERFFAILKNIFFYFKNSENLQALIKSKVSDTHRRRNRDFLVETTQNEVGESDFRKMGTNFMTFSDFLCLLVLIGCLLVLIGCLLVLIGYLLAAYWLFVGCLLVLAERILSQK